MCRLNALPFRAALPSRLAHTAECHMAPYHARRAARCAVRPRLRSQKVFRAFTRCGRRSERLLRNGAYAFLEDSDEAAKVRAAPHHAACVRGDAAPIPAWCHAAPCRAAAVPRTEWALLVPLRRTARRRCDGTPGHVCLSGVLRIVDRRDSHEQNAQARQRDRGAGRTHAHARMHTHTLGHSHTHTHTHTHTLRLTRARAHAILLQAGSKFSKTTFQSKDSNALIDVNDSKCATTCNRQHGGVRLLQHATDSVQRCKMQRGTDTA
jgi:hypothetical protein